MRSTEARGRHGGAARGRLLMAAVALASLPARGQASPGSSDGAAALTVPLLTLDGTRATLAGTALRAVARARRDGAAVAVMLGGYRLCKSTVALEAQRCRPWGPLPLDNATALMGPTLSLGGDMVGHTVMGHTRGMHVGRSMVRGGTRADAVPVGVVDTEGMSHGNAAASAATVATAHHLATTLVFFVDGVVRDADVRGLGALAAVVENTQAALSAAGLRRGAAPRLLIAVSQVNVALRYGGDGDDDATAHVRRALAPRGGDASDPMEAARLAVARVFGRAVAAVVLPAADADQVARVVACEPGAAPALQAAYDELWALAAAPPRGHDGSAEGLAAGDAGAGAAQAVHVDLEAVLPVVVEYLNQHAEDNLVGFGGVVAQFAQQAVDAACRAALAAVEAAIAAAGPAACAAEGPGPADAPPGGGAPHSDACLAAAGASASSAGAAALHDALAQAGRAGLAPIPQAEAIFANGSRACEARVEATAAGAVSKWRAQLAAATAAATAAKAEAERVAAAWEAAVLAATSHVAAAEAEWNAGISTVVTGYGSHTAATQQWKCNCEHAYTLGPFEFGPVECDTCSKLYCSLCNADLGPHDQHATCPSNPIHGPSKATWSAELGRVCSGGWEAVREFLARNGAAAALVAAPNVVQEALRRVGCAVVVPGPQQA